MRYYYIPIKMAKTKNSENIKCWQGCTETGSFIHCCGNVNGTATQKNSLKNSLRVSYKTKHAKQQFYSQAFTPREIKKYTYT